MSWLRPPPPTIWGTGTVTDVEPYVEKRNYGYGLLVTDRGVVDAGVADRVRECIPIEHRLYDEISPNPTKSAVHRVVDECEDADVVVAVGGGSVLDAAKAATALPTIDKASVADPIETLSDWDVDRPVAYPTAKTPLVLVPTTAGTGSETGHWAVISDHDRDRKVSVGHPVMRAELAVLDPDLTESLPPYMTAVSGFDVLTHALEALVATGANPLTTPAAKDAYAKAESTLATAVEQGSDSTARTTMLAASYQAGWAMNNAGLGAVHGISHAIGGLYDTPHGHTNALLLPPVVRHNAAGSERARNVYAEYVSGAADPGRTLANRLTDLRHEVDLDRDLPGLPRNPEWETVAAVAQENVNMKSNPVDLSAAEIIQICETAFE